MEIAKIPNSFAYIAVLAWPLVCLALFVKFPTDKAAVWSLLGGYMLLPSDWTIVDHPPMDKMAVTGIATLLLCWMKGTKTPPPRKALLIYLLAFGYVVAPIFSTFDNSYELQSAGKSVHGFYPIDGLKVAARNLMMLIPLHVGYRYVSTDNGRLLLLKAIPSALLLYSLPMLLEIRLSPQLHRWVYGYFPGDSFVQQIRAGGFRPVVFFPHGLVLALFTAIGLLCVVVIIRAKLRTFPVSPKLIAAYLSGLLLLCKSLGPIMYAAVFSPIILVTRPRFWVKTGCAVSLVVCAYPVLRSHDLAPTELVSGLANAISPARNASLQARLLNENLLLAKAEQKPWFGWGGWGRNRIFDQWTGKDISVTDGGWIIQFGVYGWFGYLCLFGLLACAQFYALRVTDKEMTAANVIRGGLSLILAVYLIDSIPNELEPSLVFLFAGCIASAPRVPRRATTEPIRRQTEVRSESVVLAN